MVIEKNGKVYTVKESDKKWTVSTESGKLAVSYDVSKELCGSAEQLQEYVMNNDLF